MFNYSWEILIFEPMYFLCQAFRGFSLTDGAFCLEEYLSFIILICLQGVQ
jgi:hypothetical protein